MLEKYFKDHKNWVNCGTDFYQCGTDFYQAILESIYFFSQHVDVQIENVRSLQVKRKIAVEKISKPKFHC